MKRKIIFLFQIFSFYWLKKIQKIMEIEKKLRYKNTNILIFSLLKNKKFFPLLKKLTEHENLFISPHSFCVFKF
jgi:hypothetical protein